MEQEIEKDYLTVEQVSELLQIHWQTTLSYIHSGSLPAFKLGKGYRIAKTDLLAFIEKKKSEVKK
jgi:excisionase family DNA binding protein